MIYVFEQFELDAGAVELRRDGAMLALEPQVFALLLLLVENAERLVSKDEVIEKVWDGRIVSESAVASRVKSVRKALGDDGKAQRLIRTVHGQGFRFVGAVRAVAGRTSIAEQTAGAENAAAPASVAPPAQPPEPARVTAPPSLAVLPFRLLGDAGSHAAIADAIPHDLIAGLSRLRWLFVIARGSSFRFREPDPDIQEIGRLLGVRYCLSGVVDIFGQALGVTVELADARQGGVVWAERFTASLSDVHEIRAQIVSQLIAAIEIQIPMNEARAASAAATENLDAWSAYHLGLKHMFRFNRRDNAAAAALFERAAALAPDFARAQAGLSFTHFQNAFLRYSDDPAADAQTARRLAERSVELDPADPFANYNLGRAFWLEGDLDQSFGWLDHATTLSPNFAQGHYARAWAEAISGRGEDGARHADLAMSLSPIDPMRYAMLATRALSHIVRGEDSEAAIWAERAARAPGAHALILAIAVIAHALNDDPAKAASWRAALRLRGGAVTQAHFFRAFPFADVAARARMAAALGRYGL